MLPVKKISQLIGHAKSTLPEDLSVAPQDYSQAKQLIIHEELNEEVQALKAFLEDPDTFKKQFKQRCRERAKKNADSCLSMMVMPEGYCNTLYWKIATLLFEPKTNGEILAILLPDIQQILTVDTVLPDSLPTFPRRKRLKLIEFRFQLENLTALRTPPTQPDFLKHHVSANGVLFDITSIANFDFGLHQQFHTELTQGYPQLVPKLYQHNSRLRFLLNHLELVAAKGQTFRTACKHFIQSLMVGGEKMTGESEATESAKIACALFASYLESLPEVLNQEVLALKGNSPDITVQKVLKKLEIGDCVETAAEKLSDILKNEKNDIVLDTIPELTWEEKNHIINYYKPNSNTDNLNVQIQAENALIPLVWLEKILSRHKITSVESYVNLLVSYPCSIYSILTKNVDFNSEFLAELAKLPLRIFSHTQLQAFNQAILDSTLSSHLQFTEALFLATRSNNVDLLHDILAHIPENKRFLEVIKTNEDSDGTILHIGRKNPAIVETILKNLEEKNRTKTVNIKNKYGYTVLHLAADKKESLEAILQWVNPSFRLDLFMEKSPKGTVLHAAIDKQETLSIILNSLSETEKFSLIAEPNRRNNTVLHEAIKKRDLTALKILLNALSKSDHKKALQFKNGYNQTVAYLLKRDCPDALHLLGTKSLISSSGLFKKPETPPLHFRENRTLSPAI